MTLDLFKFPLELTTIQKPNIVCPSKRCITSIIMGIHLTHFGSKKISWLILLLWIQISYLTSLEIFVNFFFTYLASHVLVVVKQVDLTKEEIPTCQWSIELVRNIFPSVFHDLRLENLIIIIYPLDFLWFLTMGRGYISNYLHWWTWRSFGVPVAVTKVSNNLSDTSTLIRLCQRIKINNHNYVLFLLDLAPQVGGSKFCWFWAI